MEELLALMTLVMPEPKPTRQCRLTVATFDRRLADTARSLDLAVVVPE